MRRYYSMKFCNATEASHQLHERLENNPKILCCASSSPPPPPPCFFFITSGAMLILHGSSSLFVFYTTPAALHFFFLYRFICFPSLHRRISLVTVSASLLPFGFLSSPVNCFLSPPPLIPRMTLGPPYTGCHGSSLLDINTLCLFSLWPSVNLFCQMTLESLCIAHCHSSLSNINTPCPISISQTQVNLGGGIGDIYALFSYRKYFSFFSFIFFFFPFLVFR